MASGVDAQQVLGTERFCSRLAQPYAAEPAILTGLLYSMRRLTRGPVPIDPKAETLQNVEPIHWTLTR